jgi:hypothetical protein
MMAADDLLLAAENDVGTEAGGLTGLDAPVLSGAIEPAGLGRAAVLGGLGRLVCGHPGGHWFCGVSIYGEW